MLSYGVQPFLWADSKGDTRFSPFYARIKSRGNRSIEELYQAAKVFSDGTTNLDWRSAKGKKAVNMPEVRLLYCQLYDEYLAENPHLLPVLLSATGIADRFGQKGNACQATELWRIRENARLGITQPYDLGEPAEPSPQLDLF